MKPSVGRIVHYVSYGTPGGEYGKECRAAVVTAVREQPGEVDLAVLNPEGMFFNREVEHHDGAGKPGDPECPNAAYHGPDGPHRYCACGWTEDAHPGGTWHWPERIEA
jgi:hypothetical protein